MTKAKASSHSGIGHRVQKQKPWSNLTDPKKLKHISKLVDKALETVIGDGSISSLQDFKEFVESYSEEHSSQPIAMELCEGTDGEIRGFRFYLISNPKERTSGKYLALNLQKHGVEIDENKYTPSAILESLGIDDEFESDVEELEKFESEIEDKFESDRDLELDDEPIAQTAKLPKQRQAGKQNGKGKSAPKQIEDFKQSLSEDELDDLLNDTDLNLEVDELASTPVKSVTKSKSKSKTQPSNGKRQQDNGKFQDQKDDRNEKPSLDGQIVVEEISNMGARAAVSGYEVNGINVAGLATQLAALGLAVGENVFKSLQNTASKQQKRLQQILDLIQEQAERTEGLIQREQRLRSFNAIEPGETELTQADKRASRILETVEKQDRRTQQLAERAEQLQTADRSARTVDDDEPSTESAETSTPKRQVQNSPAENAVEDSIGAATNQLADKVNQLGDSLDATSTPLPPIKLNPNASLDDKLTQIEEYLNRLVKRIDALEERIEALEQQAGIDKRIESELLQESSEGRAAISQQTTVANTLMAFVYSAHTEDALQNEDVLCCSLPPDRIVYVDRSSTESISISLKDKADRQLFTAISDDGSSWKVLEDSLSAREIDNIRILPQTPEAFEKQQLAQEFVVNFKQHSPEFFNGKGESGFIFTDEEGVNNYEFEVMKSKNQKSLVGYDLLNEGEQVFKATLTPSEKGSKSEYYRVEQCDIPTPILALLNESLVLEAEAEQEQKQDLAKEASKPERKPTQSRHYSDKEIEM
ncbi:MULTISPECIES: hypothetical protein [Cyanophyceae]|uniref:hypothetical protein n=1 Tax=Cyanophyceae TaxID=3028117 RepID=UPI0002A66E33|nr:MULTISPECIES: hypothetical protein [Cyanophyceae]AFZ33520.1 hypothetical protein Glo7428_5137 [Gloeocapsa sp. PCC 7428]PPS42027.1 hypothetical protein B1A85_16315 [Chroococcidiopsis sp. TS-821]